MEVGKEDRIRGSLLGLAWGDAFGCPMEGWRERDIRSVFGSCKDLPQDYPHEEMKTRGRGIRNRFYLRLRPLGIHSDDTQQALALINTCLQDPEGWSSGLWGKWLVEGTVRPSWRGFGKHFSAALGRLKRGIPPTESGSGTGGMGAAMRIGPIGALYRDNPVQLAKVAWEASLTTHGAMCAASMAFAVAYAVSALVNGQTAEQVRTTIADAVLEQERHRLEGEKEWTFDRIDPHIVSESLRNIFTDCTDLRDHQHIREYISNNARKFASAKIKKCSPNQGFVLLGGIHGLTFGLLPDIDPAAVLSSIVVLGYDTDTVAAIAGSVLGARFGCGWFAKARLLDIKRLEIYADLLVSLRNDGLESMEEYMEAEAQWTRYEKGWLKQIKDTYCRNIKPDMVMPLEDADNWARQNMAEEMLQRWAALTEERYNQQRQHRIKRHNEEKEAQAGEETRTPTAAKNESTRGGLKRMLGFYLAGVREEVRNSEAMKRLEEQGHTWSAVTQSVSDVARQYYMHHVLHE